MNERTQHLAAVTKNFLEKYQSWVELPGNELDPSMEFWVATEEALEVFGIGDMPEQFREMSEIVGSTLRPQWQQYRINAEMNDYTTLPGNGFWRGIDYFRDVLKKNSPSKRIRLEPIPDLVKQKVTLNQIALMYGWLDSAGGPDSYRVQEEIEKPGTHTGENFLPPAERERREQEIRQKEIFNRITQRRDDKLKNMEPAPEDFSELIKQGICATQISKMKKIPVSEVFKICEENNLPMPDLNYADPTGARAPQEPGNIPEAERQFDSWNESQGASRADDDDDQIDLDGGDPAMTWEQEACTLKLAGHRNGEIAQLLSTEEAKVTLPQVNGVLRKWRNGTEDYGIPYEEPAEAN